MDNPVATPISYSYTSMDFWRGYHSDTYTDHLTNEFVIALFIYRLIFIIFIFCNLDNFSERPDIESWWECCAKCVAWILLNCLLVRESMGFGTMLEERMERVTTTNVGNIFVCARYAFIIAIVVITIHLSLIATGYKKAYTCDEKSCPDCKVPKRKHTRSWRVTAIEYMITCFVLFFPMAYVMSSALVWMDSTDLGATFFSTPSLVNRTLLMKS